MPNQTPDKGQKPTVAVEQSPHSVEETGISNEEKIDRLLDTAVVVRAELHESRRKIIIGIGAATIALVLVLGFFGGVLWGLNDQADDLTDIARVNRDNGDIARENSEAIKNATGPEATARSNARLAGAIGELQRVGICAALYATDEFHPACEDITLIMDRVRAGENPFSR